LRASHAAQIIACSTYALNFSFSRVATAVDGGPSVRARTSPTRQAEGRKKGAIRRADAPDTACRQAACRIHAKDAEAATSNLLHSVGPLQVGALRHCALVRNPKCPECDLAGHILERFFVGSSRAWTHRAQDKHVANHRPSPRSSAPPIKCHVQKVGMYAFEKAGARDQYSRPT